MIARLRGEPARGPSLFSQTLTDEADVTTFERATPEQEAFVRTMLEGVDPDIFKSETGLEKGVALPGYDPPRITSITSTPGLVLEGASVCHNCVLGVCSQHRPVERSFKHWADAMDPWCEKCGATLPCPVHGADDEFLE